MGFAATNFLQLTAIFILLGWGVYLNFRNGQMYFMGVATMVIGAYSCAYAVVDLGWPMGLAILLATVLGGVASFVMSLGFARAPAFATAIATIGFVYIAQTVVRNLEFLGGVYGYYGIPRLSYLLPLTLCLLVLVGFIVYRIENSRLGRAMEMISVDPDVAATTGINRYWISVSMQTFAGATGALAGALYAFTCGALQPIFFSLAILLQVCCFFFVGGMHTMWGLVIFTPILWAVTVFLPEQIAVWRVTIYGTLLVIILLARSEGVIDRPLLRAMGNKIRQWRGLKPIGVTK